MGLFDDIFSEYNKDRVKHSIERIKDRKSDANKSKLKCKCEGGSYCIHYEHGKCIHHRLYILSVDNLKFVLNSDDVKYRKGNNGLLELLEDCPYYERK